MSLTTARSDDFDFDFGFDRACSSSTSPWVPSVCAHQIRDRKSASSLYFEDMQYIDALVWVNCVLRLKLDQDSENTRSQNEPL